MRAAREMLAQAGLDMSRYHEESFSFDEQATAPAPEPRATSTGSSYTVRFERSQRSLGCAADRPCWTPRARRPAAAVLVHARHVRHLQGQTAVRRGRHAPSGRHPATEIDQGMVLLQPPLSDLIIE